MKTNKPTALETVFKLKMKSKNLDYSFNSFSKFQKKSIIFSIIFMLLALVIGLINKAYYSNPWGIFVALTFILLSLASVVVYQVSMTLNLIKDVSNTKKDLTDSISKEFKSDFEISKELSSQYDIHHLEFSKKIIEQRSKAIRERISFLIGAIEKVGLIPLIFTFGISSFKLLNGSATEYSILITFSIGLVLIYTFAIYIITLSQKIEQLVPIFEQAIKFK